MKKLFLILFLLISISVSAQEIPEIITDRPDQSESSEIVPLKRFQVEAGFSRDRTQSELVLETGLIYKNTVENLATPEVLVRYGLFKSLELRISTAFTTTKITNEFLIKEESTSTEFGPVTIGAKIKLSQGMGIIPSSAVIVETGMPALTIKGMSSYINPAVRFCFANDLSDNASISYNLGIEVDNEQTTVTTGLYTLALGFSLSDRVGMYGEVYGFIPFGSNNGSAIHYLDGGFTFLARNNLQFDISGGYGLQKNITEYFVAVGVSARFPN
jgi:hypothetical protein